MIDVVYAVREGDDNPELELSLRSVAENFEHRRVWIAGYKPSWVSDEVGHLPVKQDGNSDWENVRNNLKAAVNSPEVSDPFVFFNDDFMVLQPVEAPPPTIYRGTWSETVAAAGGWDAVWENRWWNTLQRTVEHLELNHGIKDALVFEAHTPMLFEKKLLSQTFRLAPKVDYQVKTLYGNLYSYGMVRAPNAKSSRKLPADDTMYVSTGDATFAEDTELADWLRERFPEPCRFEKAAVLAAA